MLAGFLIHDGSRDASPSLVLFQAAVGLTASREVVSVEFEREAKRLDLRIGLPNGVRFCCPECDASGLKAYDTKEKCWRRLDFFEHQTFLTARVLLSGPGADAETAQRLRLPRLGGDLVAAARELDKSFGARPQTP